MNNELLDNTTLNEEGSVGNEMPVAEAPKAKNVVGKVAVIGLLAGAATLGTIFLVKKLVAKHKAKKAAEAESVQVAEEN